MDPRPLKRDASKVHAALKKLTDGSVVTTTGCKIYFPKRYTERGLGEISGESFVLGIFAITVGDQYYGVNNTNALMRVEPSTINTVNLDGDDYLELEFDAGTTVFPNANLVKNSTLPYQIYDEFIAKGRVPWFMDYEDMGKLFSSSIKHSGLKVGANHAIMEMIVSAIARSAKDKTAYIRHFLDANGKPTEPMAFIPLRNVSYGATNTTAKLIGSYFSDGLNSALVNPSDRVEAVEDLLRR